MSAIILIDVDTLSNTAESEKTNKLIDDPDRDDLNKPPRCSHAKVHVNSRPIL